MKTALVLLFAALLVGCPDNAKPGTSPSTSGSGAPAASASASAGSGW